MTFKQFKKVLISKGYTHTEIFKLNKLGYEAAKDAHEPMKKDIPNFDCYCQSIGRNFVMENLENIFNELICH